MKWVIGVLVMGVVLSVWVAACGKPAWSPPAVHSTAAVRGPNPLCHGLPPQPVAYCIEANRNEAPMFEPAAFDINGSCPTCRYAIRADGDGVVATFRGDVPRQLRPNRNQVGFHLSHAVHGSLRGLTTSFSRIGVVSAWGLYDAAVAVWFQGGAPTPDCPVRHHWLAVGLRPVSPLVPPASPDVLYHGPGGPCGGMFVFDATGPTIHWTRGGPLTIDWCQLLDRVHAKGVWRDVSCDATSHVKEFIELSSWTPHGKDEAIMTGGLSVGLAGWTSSR
jgi:hypothetical protein